ncbi:hypothetical protein BDZ89DRAFT_1156545 [Hymenopellis radicata]|nr:hypothetical protein BDZ89DRAFT_1156545 [Hymenopellis radicata]
MAVPVKREEHAHVAPADDPTRSSPRKRRRVEVVIELKHASQKDKKPKAQTKKAVPVKKCPTVDLACRTIMARLDPIGHEVYKIPMDQAKASAPASRLFFSHYFGGTPQGKYCPVGRDFLAKHPTAGRRRDFLCLNPLWSPYGPGIPGAPGVFFGTGRKDEWTVDMSPWSVIIFLEQNKWLYLGEYKLGKAADLTTTEWKAQDSTVRRAWTQPKDDKTAKGSGGREHRIQIHLRKQLGRESTKAEFSAALKAENNYLNITPQDIDQDFGLGNSKIHVWTMKCVGYDKQIQRTVVNEFAAFDARTKAEAAEKKILKAQENIMKRKVKKEEDETTVMQRQSGKRKVKTEAAEQGLRSSKRKGTSSKRKWKEDDSGLDEESEGDSYTIGGYTVRPSIRHPRLGAVQKRRA